MVQVKEHITSDNKVKSKVSAPKKDQLISVIIPLYNEENSIKNVISRIPNEENIEIIVVDDGSKDNSVKNAKSAKRNIKIIHHKVNQGYGAAILTGVKNAKGDILITLDSDGQHTPEEIPNLVEPILKYNVDLVVGSRYLGICNFKVPPHTRLGEIFINIFLIFLFHQPIGNNQNGFRAFKRDCLELFEKMRYSGMAYSTEVLFKFGINNKRMVEIPMTANPREFGTSYVHLRKVLISIIGCIAYYTVFFFLKKTGILKLKEKLFPSKN